MALALTLFFGFLLLSVVYASLLEWWIHKHWMHTPKYLYRAFDRHQLQHHVARKAMTRFYLRPPEVAEYTFTESSFMPWLFVIHMPLFLLVGWLFTWPAGVGFMIGSSTYLLLYELLHWAMHVPRPHWVYHVRYFKYISELHRIHHYRAWQNYNVVMPIGDFLLRTLNHDWLPPEPETNISEEEERSRKRQEKQEKLAKTV
ncbi:MAG: sterol desaturase family protein [Armatimonadetes bacterium]|nr:sterol desaturase family protein [Armatimonadota bacterium]